MIRRANMLMATQVKSKKRLVEEDEVDTIPDKRMKVSESVSLFRTPQVVIGGIFNPPV